MAIDIIGTVVALRLKQLVDSGLLARQSYQEPSRHTRNEYVLTDKGRAISCGRYSR
jgi:DNA-binding HxlR family transcriptional regulator